MSVSTNVERRGVSSPALHRRPDAAPARPHRADDGNY
jgi:hypothetical protein